MPHEEHFDYHKACVESPADIGLALPPDAKTAKFDFDTVVRKGIDKWPYPAPEHQTYFPGFGYPRPEWGSKYNLSPVRVLTTFGLAPPYNYGRCNDKNMVGGCRQEAYDRAQKDSILPATLFGLGIIGVGAYFQFLRPSPAAKWTPWTYLRAPKWIGGPLPVAIVTALCFRAYCLGPKEYECMFRRAEERTLAAKEKHEAEHHAAEAWKQFKETHEGWWSKTKALA